MPKHITVIFNYRSPFCALIVDRVFQLERHYDVQVEWKITREVPRPSSLPITEDNLGSSITDRTVRAEPNGSV